MRHELLSVNKLTVNKILGNSSANPGALSDVGRIGQEIYYKSTGTSASSSVRPVYMYTNMAGVGSVGGRAEFYMYTNVALGAWSNALKGVVEYGASGKTAGLGSAVLAEMSLSAGTTDGNYALFEGELNMAAGALTGTKTALMFFSVNGAAAGTFDSNGYIMTLNGLTAGAGKVFAANAATVSHVLRINIGGTDYYLCACDAGGLA